MKTEPLYGWSMIRYSTDITGLDITHLDHPFFVGWPNPPDSATHLEILRRSSVAVVAVDGEHVVGFVTAVSDGVLAAFVPLLEVTPGYQGSGIGSELVRRLVARLDPIYAIDAVCDPELVPFYERLGFTGITAVARRNYAVQAGTSA